MASPSVGADASGLNRIDPIHFIPYGRFVRRLDSFSLNEAFIWVARMS